MEKQQKIVLTLLRVAMGWLFLYAGITKIFDPAWSAAGYLTNASSFASFYNWLALPANIGWINFVNEWGLTLIGIALILGVFVRWASYAGIVLMVLYWLPVLNFPYVGDHSYIVDEHVIYVLALAVLAYFNAGKYWTVRDKLKKMARS